MNFTFIQSKILAQKMSMLTVYSQAEKYLIRSFLHSKIIQTKSIQIQSKKKNNILLLIPNLICFRGHIDKN